MVEIVINDKKVIVQKGLTILQACEENGIQVPRFCYHEQLSIAGNCRMCLIELDKSVKPIASCAIACENGMKIFTNTILVKKAREGVMEFLLINHPLDCPICDQGGECDLQDQAMLFGNDRGRFYENKRSVSDLDLGPFVKTVMTRCIHCTRCIRFLTELGGSFVMGTTGRGVKTEVGTYISTFLDSEVSGNIIDLCPVGALTSKPYAFTARPWELTKIESIDTLDSMCSNVSYHIFGGKILRVLPVLHMGVNEEWLTNTTRFSYDGYLLQRLTVPLLKENGSLVKKNFNLFIKFFKLNINDKILVLLSDDLSLETVYAVKNLKNLYTFSDVVLKNRIVKRNIDFRKNYLFNSAYSNISQADLVCLVGCDLKKEMPLLLVRLRKEKRKQALPILNFGSTASVGLEEKISGVTTGALIRLSEGKHKNCVDIKKAKKPLFFIGLSLIMSKTINAIPSIFSFIPNVYSPEWNGLNFVEKGAGVIGCYEVGIQGTSVLKKADTIVNINNLNIKLCDNFVKKSVFIGTHGANTLAAYTDIVPIKTNVEQANVFVNNEGRSQLTKVVQVSNKDILEGWDLLFKLFDRMFIRKKISLTDVYKSLQNIANNNLNSISYQTFFVDNYKKKLIIDNKPLVSYIGVEYANNAVTIYSRILVKAKKYIKKNNYI